MFINVFVTKEPGRRVFLVSEKPTKADKSLAANPERAILMPKFVMVFSKVGKRRFAI